MFCMNRPARISSSCDVKARKKEESDNGENDREQNQTWDDPLARYC